MLKALAIKLTEKKYRRNGGEDDIFPLKIFHFYHLLSLEDVLCHSFKVFFTNESTVKFTFETKRESVLKSSGTEENYFTNA